MRDCAVEGLQIKTRLQKQIKSPAGKKQAYHRDGANTGTSRYGREELQALGRTGPPPPAQGSPIPLERKERAGGENRSNFISWDPSSSVLEPPSFHPQMGRAFLLTEGGEQKWDQVSGSCWQELRQQAAPQAGAGGAKVTSGNGSSQEWGKY